MKPIDHARTKKTYEGAKFNRKVEAIWSKDETIGVRRLRIGHSLDLRAYRHRIGLEEEDTCRFCDEQPEDIEHLIEACPALVSFRRENMLTSMKSLVERPEGALKLLEKLRRRRPHDPGRPIQ